MSRIFSAFGVAGGIFASACNTCATHIAPFTSEHFPPEDIVLPEEPRADDIPEEFSLPKDDWNGLKVMMTEGQARGALRNIGFHVVPGRSRTMLTYDPLRQIVHLWRMKEDLPTLVFMETERKERVLPNVWGVQLVFLQNRLFQFSPQYFTNPVELVEPDDEYVTADDMQMRLIETFGGPNILDGEIEVVYPDERGKRRERVCLWADATLSIILRRMNDSGIVRYTIVFSSPDGMKSMEKALSKSLQSTKKKSEPEEITF